MPKKKNITFDAMVKFFVRKYSLCTTKDIDKVLARLDRMERKIDRLQKTKTTIKSDTKKIGAGKKYNVPASDIVVNIVASSPEGISFSDILKKTGFTEKKLRNIIFRLTKTERIQTKSRGIYFSA